MIVKQMKNQSFRSTLDYVLGKKGAEILERNMGGNTPRQLSQEFAAARSLRPNFKRACAHVSFSLSPGEELSNDEFTALAEQWLSGMGFLGEDLANSQYIIVRHTDTEHSHIHVVASRIKMDGSVVSDSWNYRRSEVLVRQLEKDFGLEPVCCSSRAVASFVEGMGIPTSVSSRRALTTRQKRHSSGEPPLLQLIADAIDEALITANNLTEFIAALQERDIKIHPQFSTQGIFQNAVAFSMDSLKVAGNKLGNGYSFPGLLRRGLDFELERDLPALIAASKGEKVTVTPPVDWPAAKEEIKNFLIDCGYPQRLDEAKFKEKKSQICPHLTIEQRKELVREVADELNKEYSISTAKSNRRKSKGFER